MSAYDKHIRFILAIFYIALGILSAYFIFSKIIGWIAPFILALIVSYMLDPLISLLEKKAKINRKIGTVLSILLILLGIGSALTFLVMKLVEEMTGLISMLFEITNKIPSLLDQYESSGGIIDIISAQFNVDIGNLVQMVSREALSYLTSFINPMIKGVTGFAASIPNVLIFIIVFFVSTYFMCSDKMIILNFIKKQVPHSWLKIVLDLKEYLLLVLVKYINALLILLGITFVELSIGFSIIGIKYSIALAALVSLIDALPILGTGTVLIPWGVLLLIGGDYKTGISLLVLYIVILIVRQILEPKIVGHQIGLHPLVTLISVYVGLKIMGFGGMILFPMVVLIIINLQRNNLIRVWK